MAEMHYFKESRREKIPFPGFKGNVTIRILLEFVFDLCVWSHASPSSIRMSVEKEVSNLYILFRNMEFCEWDFWQTFGGYLIAFQSRWQIDILGSELRNQETVELSLENKNDKFYAVQKTVSGRYASNISSLCLRISCADEEEATIVDMLCQSTDWNSGILVVEWALCKTFAQEDIPWLHQNTCYCYGNILEDQEQQDYLEPLTFQQKVNLWLQFLENGYDYTEFAWLYDRISKRKLNNRTEWELTLYTALNQLGYTLKISESEFELYDGKDERRYFSFNSEQNAQRVFLKLLFPLNS